MVKELDHQSDMDDNEASCSVKKLRAMTIVPVKTIRLSLILFVISGAPVS